MSEADLALVLALDGSASVTYEEFNLIAGGLAAALRDPDVVAGLTAGPRGVSYASLLLWSGTATQEVLVEWTRIATPLEARRFADAVDDSPRLARPGLTAIGAALAYAAGLFAVVPERAARRVIDVAGDGGSNDGPPPGPVRDALAADGITVNGLCVLHDEPDLLAYYLREVVGGPDGFALTCPDYAAYAEAMRRKLVQEIA